jgi:hypothetical protein
MKLNRTASTSDRVNQLLSKDEPDFIELVELDKGDITLALNWYSQNRDKDASHKYLAAYCKQHGIKATAAQIESQVSTVGFVCRMISRGAKLDANSLQYVDKKIKDMIQNTSPQDPAPTAPPKPAPSPEQIHARLKEKTSRCLGELEGAIDEFILSDFKKLPDTLSILRTHDLKDPHTGPYIVNFMKKWADECRIALTEKDPVINEAYQNYTLVQLKKMVGLYDQIISDTLKVMGEHVAAKPQRAKRVKSPEQQIKKLKFCETYAPLSLTSIRPIRIVGASELFAYNTKTRMLTHYHAENETGLGIKGSTVTNYATTSRTKKLRKPEVHLPKLLTSGKVILKHFMENLTTRDGKVTGRINTDTVLLKIIV